MNMDLRGILNAKRLKGRMKVKEILENEPKFTKLFYLSIRESTDKDIFQLIYDD